MSSRIASILALLALLQLAVAANVKNQFVVTLKSGADLSAHRASVKSILTKEAQQPHASSVGIKNAVHHDYNIGTFKGYSGTFTPTAIDAIKNDPNVASVHPAVEMHALGTQSNPPSWGLTRVGQRTRKIPGSYVYPDAAGQGSTVFVIDTGIDVNHPDFDGRAVWGNTACQNCQDYDDNGHGTHCAGTIGGRTFGVAKQTSLVAVKVLAGDGSGSDADVIAGINWVADQVQNGGVSNAVASMSLGGGVSDTLDQAVQAAIDAGITFAVAAGNESTDACNGSPARVASAITVGATDKTDTRASYSNYGSCVSIFGPGSAIVSAKAGTTGSTSLSGTSMATPHVAGVAAILLSQTPGLSPAQVKSKIVSGATKNVVKSAGSGSPNKFLFNNVA